MLDFPNLMFINIRLNIPDAPKQGLLHWYPIIVWGKLVKQKGIAPFLLNISTVTPSLVLGLNRYCVNPAVASHPLTWKHSFILTGRPCSGFRSIVNETIWCVYFYDKVHQKFHIIRCILVCNFTFQDQFITFPSFIFSVFDKLNNAILFLVYLYGFPLECM